MNPTTITSKWRDVIYKGRDNYYLEASSTNAGKPVGAGTSGRQHEGLRYGAARDQHLDASRDHLRRSRAHVLREREPGQDYGRHGDARDLGRSPADRRRQHLRPVLRGHDRRGPHLQHGSDAGADTGRHDLADRLGELGYPGSDGPDEPQRDRRGQRADRPDLDGIDGQRGRDGISGRAMPGAACSNFASLPATPTGMAYTDTGLSPNTTYRYRVRAIDAAANLSGYSNIAGSTTQPGGSGPPGLVAAYAFDEGTGSTVADSSGNGNNGTLRGRHGRRAGSTAVSRSVGPPRGSTSPIPPRSISRRR